ncbi:MAG: FlgD immunoglobulin-like domain containing protein [Elusimicrobiota bacterium]
MKIELFILSLFLFAGPAFAGWSIQTVDSTGEGEYLSIALDSSNNPHISYYDGYHSANGDLKYAKWTGSAWSVQTVDSVGWAGYYTSIALDSGNNPHISYYDVTNGDLKYAKWTGSAWSIQTIDSVGDVGTYTSIALDSGNNPHISYYDVANGDLKYAKWTGTSWSTQTVDSIGNVGQYTSIALDPSNNPNISYYDATNGDLKYAKWTGTSWSTQTVDSLGDVGGYTSIALDSGNNPHIAYRGNNLKYAKWTGSVWSIQSIDYASGGYAAISLALDVSNNPHISYYHSNSINYANWNGSSWSTHIVESNGLNSGSIACMALDSGNNPHIVYGNYESADLRYAKLLNYSPVLIWTGEINYTTDGLGPNTAHAGATFIFRVKYKDSDGDAPASGYPLVHVLKNSIELASSPFAMILFSGEPVNGAIYAYSKVLTSTGTDYTYYFEAQDDYNGVSTGTPVVIMSGPSVTNVAPVLTWTSEVNYTADGVEPGTAHINSTVIFRVKYSDADNDAPASGYPKLHVKKGEAEISGSPFAMSFVSGTPVAGSIYAYSEVLTSTGTDYTYYFEAQDAYNAVSTGTPVVIMNGPSVTNSTPTLAWTGEVNYTATGLAPSGAHAGSTFIFRVKYKDLDGDAPAMDYPLVHVLKNSAELSGSPFAMNFVSGTPAAGSTYTYSKILTSTGTDYTYYFEAQDVYNAVSTGTSVIIMSGPSVTNAAPTLAWTGETSYSSDGISPNTGDLTTSFVFRVKYSDTDSDAPYSGYPKLHIKKGGVEIGDSPFTMNFVSGSNGSGATYTYTKSLTYTGSDYTYYFEAQDAYNADATGTPLTPVSGPIVSNHAPTLAWTGEANYTADGLDPESGDRNTNLVFRVKYTDADNQAPNTGYPRLHIKKGGTEITGSPFGMTEADAGDTVYTDGKLYTYAKTLLPGTDYAYYFEAQDSDGVDATGTPTAQIDAPDVSNQAPALAWTGETSYSTAGLYPLKGDPTDTYVFRVKYTDDDNDAPSAGYPRVRIKKSGADISGSPFAMNYVSGANNAGVIYSLSKTLAAGAYVYSFDALDLYAGQAAGEPLTEQSGPVVIGADLPPAQEVKVYHGVFKPGENEKTNVSFNTTAPVSITVTVYNNIGRKVIELYHGTSSAGLNLIQWDGKNDSGQRVSSGVYTIKIEGGGINQSKRVVVVR